MCQPPSERYRYLFLDLPRKKLLKLTCHTPTFGVRRASEGTPFPGSTIKPDENIARERLKSIYKRMLTLFWDAFAIPTKSSISELIFENLIINSVAVDINSMVTKEALFARKSLFFRVFPFPAQNAFHSVTKRDSFLIHFRPRFCTFSAENQLNLGRDFCHRRQMRNNSTLCFRNDLLFLPFSFICFVFKKPLFSFC